MASPWDERLCHVGFGFDRINNDIKVVNIVYRYRGHFKNDNEFDSVWVFSYVTWSWKWKHVPCSILRHCSISSSSVFFNGVLYWNAFHREEYYYFTLTFDLTHEVFGQILFPSDARPYPSGHSNYIVSTGESLLLIQRNHKYSSFIIWTLKQFGNQEFWENTLSITTKIVPDHILGATKNGDLILEIEGGQIHKYNPTNLTHSLVTAMENSVFFSYHTESLYLLEKGEDAHSY
ncbi:hypothetical protein K1719_022958 [Acacia pycnantha]|nr:hypothetical protein K1719_022958 [Acacia pycnantha]